MWKEGYFFNDFPHEPRKTKESTTELAKNNDRVFAIIHDEDRAGSSTTVTGQLLIAKTLA